MGYGGSCGGSRSGRTVRGRLAANLRRHCATSFLGIRRTSRSALAVSISRRPRTPSPQRRPGSPPPTRGSSFKPTEVRPCLMCQKGRMVYSLTHRPSVVRRTGLPGSSTGSRRAPASCHRARCPTRQHARRPSAPGGAASEPWGRRRGPHPAACRRSERSSSSPCVRMFSSHPPRASALATRMLLLVPAKEWQLANAGAFHPPIMRLLYHFTYHSLVTGSHSYTGPSHRHPPGRRRSARRWCST